jgi:integrase
VSITTPKPGQTVAPNVRVHPNGQSFEVRVSPFTPVAGYPLTDEGLDDATAFAIKLRKRRAAGITGDPDARDDEARTLAEATADHLADLDKVGGRNGTPYGREGMKAAKRDARPWLGEKIPPRFGKGGAVIEAVEPVDEHGRLLGATPLDELRLAPIESFLVARYEVTPRAAVGESQMLHAVLAKETAKGRKLDPTLLAGLPRLKRQKQRRRGFHLLEYEFLLEHVVEHQRPLIRLGTTLGGRIMELLQAEDAWVDFDARVLTIPAWACKERRDKPLPLLAEELELIREAQRLRSPSTVRGRYGTRLLHPRRHGSAWSHRHFYEQVVAKSRRRAAKAWRELDDLADDAPTPFEWVVRDRHGDVVLAEDGTAKIGGFQPHDMRRSAATIMRELGVPPELAALRLGHKDAGYLLVTVYADSRAEALRAELDRIDEAGGVAAAFARRAAG